MTFRTEKQKQKGRLTPPLAIPAPESALGLHPCIALSSAQAKRVYGSKSVLGKPRDESGVKRVIVVDREF